MEVTSQHNMADSANMGSSADIKDETVAKTDTSDGTTSCS